MDLVRCIASGESPAQEEIDKKISFYVKMQMAVALVGVLGCFLIICSVCYDVSLTLLGAIAFSVFPCCFWLVGVLGLFVWIGLSAEKFCPVSEKELVSWRELKQCLYPVRFAEIEAYRLKIVAQGRLFIQAEVEAMQDFISRREKQDEIEKIKFSIYSK